MKRLYNLVQQNDLAVYKILVSQNLKPEFFAFRWITLLLSQEFKLPGIRNFFFSYFQKLFFVSKRLFLYGMY